jgi:hypothetical protein
LRYHMHIDVSDKTPVQELQQEVKATNKAAYIKDNKKAAIATSYYFLFAFSQTALCEPFK